MRRLLDKNKILIYNRPGFVVENLKVNDMIILKMFPFLKFPPTKIRQFTKIWKVC